MDKRNIAISLPSMGEEEWQAVREPIFSGWVTQGPKVAEFEKAFAARHGASHGLAVTSCTTALQLILAAMGIGPGDEVIVPSFTWVASANAVLYVGAKPVLVDVDRSTYTMSLEDVASKLTAQTRAIIAVHLFGLCVDIDALAELAPRVPIVEDAACAAASQYKGRNAGELGLAAAFSFHPRKSITTGEGGMITTNNAELAEQMAKLRNHGASISEAQRHHGPRPYLLPEFDVLGFNFRMTDLQGAVGLAQLAKLDQFVTERRQWAKYYNEELAEIEWLNRPSVPADMNPSWQSYVCYVDPAKAPLPRNEIMEILQAKGISTRPGTHAVHMLGYYRDEFGFTPDALPGARDCDLNTMASPLHNRMVEEDYAYVVAALKAIGK